jgi:hypothetical protein
MSPDDEEMVLLNNAVIWAREFDDAIESFITRHGESKIEPAILGTIRYLRGETTRRGVARNLGVPAIDGINITQAIEPILYTLKERGLALTDVEFEYEPNPRDIEQEPYHRHAAAIEQSVRMFEHLSQSRDDIQAYERVRPGQVLWICPACDGVLETLGVPERAERRNEQNWWEDPSQWADEPAVKCLECGQRYRLRPEPID